MVIASGGVEYSTVSVIEDAEAVVKME